jgi:hypothetical protein
VTDFRNPNRCNFSSISVVFICASGIVQDPLTSSHCSRGDTGFQGCVCSQRCESPPVSAESGFGCLLGHCPVALMCQGFDWKYMRVSFCVVQDRVISPLCKR